MIRERTRRISEAFGKAHAYDQHAAPQAATAQALSGLILSRGLPDNAHVLDIGCGTGGLASHLLTTGKPGCYLCADISPAMLGRARAKLDRSRPHPLFAAMDAASPACRAGFHLVASNMALHWTADMGEAIRLLWALLLPGGLLALSVPGSETFASWREAHQRLGLPCGLRDFPSAVALKAMFPAAPDMTERFHQLPLARALDLPRHLKAVGGYVPRAGHTPLTPGQFRAVLADLDARGPSASYHVLYALAKKSASE